MTRGFVAALTWALLTWVTGGISLRTDAAKKPTSPTDDVVVGGVHVMPPDFEDPYRSRSPIPLFADGMVPGKRVSSAAPGFGTPAFNADGSIPEAFLPTPKGDIVGMMCSPGGHAYGHYFYNVMEPEIVPFMVPEDQPNRTDMAVVVAPGGGHVHLAWEPSGVGPAEWLNSIGVSAFVVKYRVPDSTGQLQLMDLQRAMSLIRSTAVEYGVNASRIGFMGSSASGKLALQLATGDERSYARIDEVDDVSYKPDFLIAMFPGESEFVTPELAAKLPPMFLAHAKDDPCVGDAEIKKLASTVEKFSSKPFLYKDYKHGKHGWDTCEYYPDALMGKEMCTWKQLADSFLRQNVLGEQ